jgi:hypothetical protein
LLSNPVLEYAQSCLSKSKHVCRQVNTLHVPGTCTYCKIAKYQNIRSANPLICCKIAKYPNIWSANPLICCKIAKYPISESIIFIRIVLDPSVRKGSRCAAAAPRGARQPGGRPHAASRPLCMGAFSPHESAAHLNRVELLQCEPRVFSRETPEENGWKCFIVFRNGPLVLNFMFPNTLPNLSSESLIANVCIEPRNVSTWPKRRGGGLRVCTLKPTRRGHFLQKGHFNPATTLPPYIRNTLS